MSARARDAALAWTCAFIIGCGHGAGPARPGTAPPAVRAPRPNIVFLISDDQSADDLGVAGNAAVRTPSLDAFAAAGMRFESAYASSPQCSPGRIAVLTGRTPHATGTSRLHATLRDEQDTVVDALRRGGYFVGAFRKVHAGDAFQKHWQFYGDDDVPFEKFFQARPKDQPFFLWVGFHDPHRPYGDAPATGHDAARVSVPPFLPDTPAVREDLGHYDDEITRMDGEVGAVLALLKKEGLDDNTVVVFASDNGMPFPGAKGSLYDAGVRIPLMVRWPGNVPRGRVNDGVVSLLDLAPTWLALAGLAPLPRMEGRSLLGAWQGGASDGETAAFFERNWHDNLDLSRGVRRGPFLLIQNYRPELPYEPTDDLASSPSWGAIMDLWSAGKLPETLAVRYGKAPRPTVELFDVEKDRACLHNLATDPAQAATVSVLQEELSRWMVETNDFLPPPIPRPRGEQGEQLP